MTITHPPAALTIADVLLDPVAEHQWRVLDTRAITRTPESILGFICAVAGIYEVTPLARPLAVVFCANLADARDAIYDFSQAPA